MRSRWGTIISLAGIVAALAVGPAASQSWRVDTNGDGRSDAQNILDAVSYLNSRGVTFNDKDGQGHRPVFRNGNYQMACIDLVLVAYRAAGFDLCAATRGGPLLRPVGGYLDYAGAPGSARSISSLVPYMKKSPAWRYFDERGADPTDANWRPKEPYQVGDIMFLHYSCTEGARHHDRHSGIVTAVDAATGRPKRVSQVSTYNPREGLQDVSIPTLFNLWCRRLSGHAHPASWGQPKVIASATGI